MYLPSGNDQEYGQDLLTSVHNSDIHTGEKLKLNYPSSQEWLQILCYIYLVEFYNALKMFLKSLIAWRNDLGRGRGSKINYLKYVKICIEKG